MNRLQTKCFLAAVGAHLLLLIILIVGPGFFHSKPKDTPAPPLLNFIPENIVMDAIGSGGGNPTVEPAPAPAPPPVKEAVPPPPAPPEIKPVDVPPPTPPKRVEVEPPPVPKEEKINPKALIPQDKKKAAKKPVKPVDDVDDTPKPTTSKTKSKKPEIEVNLKEVVRKTDDAKEKQRREQIAAQRAQQEQARQYQKYLAQRNHQLDGAMRSLGNGLSSGLNIEMPSGAAGAAFASYGQVVMSMYESAWLVPTDVSSDAPSVRATVTIASNGSVITARVIDASGNSRVDRSVERVLKDVKFIAPFPEGVKESQRTFTIEFNVKIKRQIG